MIGKNAVAVIKFVRCAVNGANLVLCAIIVLGAKQHVRDLTAIRACVHVNATAHRARNTAAECKALIALLAGIPANVRQARTALRMQRIAIKAIRVHLGGENHHTAISRIREQHVGAVADHTVAQSALLQHGKLQT